MTALLLSSGNAGAACVWACAMKRAKSAIQKLTHCFKAMFMVFCVM